MTQTLVQPVLTEGTLDLAGKLLEQRHFLVGPAAIHASTEAQTLVELGMAKINRSHLILLSGGRRALEKAVRAQLQQNSAPPNGGD